MISLARLFPDGWRFSSSARLKLAHAYRELFDPKGEAAQLVLADLAEASGFFKITPADATPDQLRQAEGRRELFARITGHLNLSQQRWDELERVASEEASALASARYLEAQRTTL